MGLGVGQSRWKVYLQWWKTWATLPVFDWVEAAYLYKQGEYRSALSLYTRGLERHPEHPAGFCARLDLAYCYFRLGEVRRARQELKHVVLYAPRLREAHVRLAKVQLWCSEPFEAAWTIRRALRELAPDGELVGLFLNAVLDNGGPEYLLRDGMHLLEKLSEEEQQHPRIELARARLRARRGVSKETRAEIARLATKPNSMVDEILAFSEILLKEEQVLLARQHLQRALVVSPNHPRVLSMLAESYLRSGDLYNAEHAVQLASVACQSNEWCSAREMHVLAEAYYHNGDNMAALLMASKAKQVGKSQIGSYRGVKLLDELIQTISQHQSQMSSS